MTTPQETLLDYTPSQEEEIARLRKLAETQALQMQAILDDPSLKQFEAIQKIVAKRFSEYAKLKESHKKITQELRVVIAPTLEQPTEDGFYILKSVSEGYSNSIYTRRTLLQKTMGTWFNMEDGECFAHMNWRRGNAKSFEAFCGIDEDTIEVTLERLADQSRYPKELLGDDDESGTDDAETEEEA